MRSLPISALTSLTQRYGNYVMCIRRAPSLDWFKREAARLGLTDREFGAWAAGRTFA